MSQIPMQSSEFGKAIGVYVRYKVLEDSTKDVKLDGGDIFAGRAVAIDPTTGKLVPVTTNVAIYGLAKANMNSYRNEVSDTSFGIYGSGMMTVIIAGIVDLQANVFPNTDGSYTSVPTWDAALNYAVGEEIYVTISGEKAGQFTNVKVAEAGATRNDNTKVGKVLVAPSASNPVMQLLIGF